MIEANKKAFAEQMGRNYVVGHFLPSLEMKEKTDFLLTPALLVQEALSNDVLLTYPDE